MLVTHLLRSLLFVVVILVDKSLCLGKPLYIGLFKNEGCLDPAILTGQQAVNDGMRAAIKSVNAAGGVHGRPLQLIECETFFLPTKYRTCWGRPTQASPAMERARSGIS